MVVVSVVCDFHMYARCIRNNPFVQGAVFVDFDNRIPNRGIPECYNQFLDGYDYANPDWFVFCHEDWEVLELLEDRLSGLDPASLWGPIGASFNGRRTRRLGRILNSNKDGSGLRVVGKPCAHGTEVGTFDCQCLVVHSSLVRKFGLRFDDRLCWDLYVEDFCISAKEDWGVCSRIAGLYCQHYSFGRLTSGFYAAVSLLQEKYALAGGVYTSTARTVRIGHRNRFYGFLGPVLRPLARWFCGGKWFLFSALVWLMSH